MQNQFSYINGFNDKSCFVLCCIVKVYCYLFCVRIQVSTFGIFAFWLFVKYHIFSLLMFDFALPTLSVTRYFLLCLYSDARRESSDDCKRQVNFYSYYIFSVFYRLASSCLINHSKFGTYYKTSAKNFTRTYYIISAVNFTFQSGFILY